MQQMHQEHVSKVSPLLVSAQVHELIDGRDQKPFTVQVSDSEACSPKMARWFDTPTHILRLLCHLLGHLGLPPVLLEEFIRRERRTVK